MSTLSEQIPIRIHPSKKIPQEVPSSLKEEHPPAQPIATTPRAHEEQPPVFEKHAAPATEAAPAPPSVPPPSAPPVSPVTPPPHVSSAPSAFEQKQQPLQQQQQQQRQAEPTLPPQHYEAAAAHTTTGEPVASTAPPHPVPSAEMPQQQHQPQVISPPISEQPTHFKNEPTSATAIPIQQQKDVGATPYSETPNLGEQTVPISHPTAPVSQTVAPEATGPISATGEFAPTSSDALEQEKRYMEHDASYRQHPPSYQLGKEEEGISGVGALPQQQQRQHGETSGRQKKLIKAAQPFVLNDGQQMPPIAVGTFTKNHDEVGVIVREALNAGYRHLDCAWIYGNQNVIGKEIQTFLQRQPSLKTPIESTTTTTTSSTAPISSSSSQEAYRRRREKLFVSSKLWNTYHKRVEENCVDTLRQLGLEYLDLFLVQWPVAFKFTRPTDPFPRLPVIGNLAQVDDEAWLLDTWRQMEALVDKGLVRSIGVSHFNLKQLQRIIEFCRIPPAVLQVEMHPRLPQFELRDFCRRHNIRVVAISPFGAPELSFLPETRQPDQSSFKKTSLLDDDEIKSIASKTELSNAQLLVHFPLELDCGIIIKSSKKQRLQQNLCCGFDKLKIHDAQMRTLEQMGATRPHRFIWFAPARNSREYPF